MFNRIKLYLLKEWEHLLTLGIFSFLLSIITWAAFRGHHYWAILGATTAGMYGGYFVPEIWLALRNRKRGRAILLAMVVAATLTSCHAKQSMPATRLYRVMDKVYGCPTCTGEVKILDLGRGFRAGDTIVNDPSTYTTKIIIDTLLPQEDYMISQN